ncbi:MAG TPA: choice-of-anchor L domain-containing protein [Thermoanaerobaculia bacterium]|nr:choice-of-anchor L domain-containing protein [Thermoanaerobaculia bacterium]
MRFRPFRSTAILLLTLGATLAASTASAAPPRTPSPQSVVERQQIAHRRLLSAPAAAITTNGSELAAALDVDPGIVVSSTFSGPTGSGATLPGLGVIQPLRGSSFAVLSTGIIGSVPEPGADFPPASVGGDQASFTLVLRVPAGESRLSFDFNFLSAEYPDFIGSQFNDTFLAVLSDANGSRVIAQASVNSSFFFPASSSRAGGSGFDIFSQDPEGVDEVFGTGLPDAGVTDFQSVDVPVTSNGTITLTFSVEDQGDGILDSAIVLDNLQAASIEVLDASSSNANFLSGGRVTSDPNVAATGGESRRGIAADGVSRLILRSPASGPGNVRWCLVGGGTAPADGGLAALGGDGRDTCVNTTVAQTSAGFQAFAVFRAPGEFSRGSGDDPLDKRPVRIRATANGTSVREVEIQIVRPPVVLVHGLWSNAATWQFPLAGDPRFEIYPANYKDTAAARFAANGSVVPLAIRDVLKLMRQREYASTQVDVVGHSMGGLLSRIWTTAGGYRRNDNYNAGDIHKLITVDSPHSGSPLANLLAAVRDTPLIGPLAAGLLAAGDMPVHLGAIDDLRKGSAAIKGMGAAPVPTHALVGKGGSDLVGGALEVGGDALSKLPGWPGVLFKTLSFFGTVQKVFPGIQHDLVVGRDSQEGGLPTSAVDVIGGGDGVHIPIPVVAVGNTASSIYSNQIVHLLNADADSSEFARLPSAATLGSTANPEAAAEFSFVPDPARAVSPGVRIASPTPGTIVSPGQTLEVVVEPVSGAKVQRVLLTGPEVAAVDQQAPFRLQITVPLDTAGALDLKPLGANAAGDYFTGNGVQLIVRPTTQLTKLDLQPDEIILTGTGASRPLTVVGTYADGVIRDITEPLAGTTYQTVDPEIVTVSPQGRLTAQGAGTTTVVARNGEVQDSITVRILPSPAPCQPGTNNLCLGQNRFRVQLEWTDFQGQHGTAHSVPLQTSDSGLLWFFDSDNWEAMVKVLNGCSLNGRFWVFAAATTNLGYTLTVTDTQTGDSRVYANTLGQAAPAVTDTDAFSACPAQSQALGNAAIQELNLSPAVENLSVVSTEAKAPCVPGSGSLCLSDRRFRVEVTWKDFQGRTGSGTVVPFGADDSGLFWFFASTNWEMLVKVVDGCALNGRFWIFSAAVTNVQYTLRVTDTVTGKIREYKNPLGTSSRAITDTGTFQCH